MIGRIACAVVAALVAVSAVAAPSRGADRSPDIKGVVDAAIQPLMTKYGVPGMAVGVTVGGKTYVYDYGVASRETGKPVTRDTLFEIGSVSKTFTATLTSYAQGIGKLSLSGTVERYVPSLRGTAFGAVQVLNLGTHTPGGLPLQVPEDVTTDRQLTAYLAHWRPAYAAGSYRTYSNVSIGMLGVIAAKSMHGAFADLMEQRLFSPLGMKHTYINVPQAQSANYAQGYTKTDSPVRMTPGVLWQEAYGVRTTADDLLRFVAANIDAKALDTTLGRALEATRTGYFNDGGMTQDLIWEQYRYPVALPTLLDGNAPKMLFEATPVTRIAPPQEPLDDAWINKTGSTNGFGTYVAFIPKRHLGIVLLANKNYPMEDRVRAAYQIISRLLPVAGKRDDLL